MDRGWRRSGKYLYKPLMEKTCCPQYTIRLDVQKFRLSRTQKRVLRAMKNYLLFDIKPKEKCVVKTENYGSINKNNNQIKKLKQINKRINSQPNECVTKKKYLRRLKAEERLKLKGVDLEKYKKERAEKETSRIKTLQSYLEYLSVEKMENEWKHRLKVTLVGQPSPQFDKDFNEEFNIFKRYQIEIHKDDPNELSTNSFTRFLASSPLINEEEKDKQRHLIPLGSYHQQYRLDGRIIAVGVIDILPNCFSSKYLFYDPDYSFLSLGVFSALFEINFTKQLALQRPNLHYYYMGFYLYDCPKMRYKECFRPSDLLCDYCYDWVPITECNRLLEENNGRFTTFHPNIEKSKKEEPTEQQLSQVQCLTDNILINFGNLRATLEANGDYEELEEITEKVRNFAYYLGPASSQIVLML
ncbi:Arginyl-tRNA--protein transferase 1 [Meloidogyne graminicola]|uniref:Arginyl-tRNA--protein transferase 1 n=1 Tax=Meloidogyne graminicola TaxID=189291 RepID=A0A8S9ZQJ2_9BILA|nr:Arginyl-tRNA--protein transferase 1 [Meloidogyne graminicola]